MWDVVVGFLWALERLSIDKQLFSQYSGNIKIQWEDERNANANF